MTRIKPLLERYSLTPIRYTIQKQNHIIETDQGKFFIKPKKRVDKKNLYQYLLTRNFPYFPQETNDLNRDDYEIYPYIEEIPTPKEQKASDLIYLMSLLHNKTTFYKAVDLDDVKARYESLLDQIVYLNSYYHDLQDLIETDRFMSPSAYLLIRQMSLVYQALDYSKRTLEQWYQVMSQKKKERFALVHRKMTLDHLLEGETPYLISWDQASVDSPISDFYTFFETYYDTLDMSSFLSLYESKYPLLTEEKAMLFVLCSIPEKILLDQKEYQNTLAVKKMITRLLKANDMILKEHPENTPKQ